MGRSTDVHESHRRRSLAARGLLSVTAAALIGLPAGMAAAQQLPQPPPLDGCAADPASCLPDPADVDGCLQDPKSCLPQPPVDECSQDPASCLPEPPPVDECVQDPESCLPEGQEVDRCVEAPQSCLPEVRDEEEPLQEEGPGKDDDGEEGSVAPLKGGDPPRRSRAGLVSPGGEREAGLVDPPPPSSTASLRERPASKVGAPSGGILDRIGRGLTDAAQRFAFPLAVAGLVAAFVLLQGRIDRRDPKLATAPIDGRDDVVEFR